MSARDRILERVRAAVEPRDTTDHPGAFGSWRPEMVEGSEPEGPVDAFVRAFTSVGGEVAYADGHEEAGTWLAEVASDLAGITVGRGVPPSLVPAVPRLPAHEAPLAISWSRGAVAETGSIILESSDGRRSQLLAPTHVVLVPSHAVHLTLANALSSLRPELPAAVGLHSGPSRSADIGQVMVRGVHGPGRIIALLLSGDARSG